MLVYVEDKQQFLSDVSNNLIDRKVEQQLREKLRRGVSRSERQAFINSLTHMQNILSDEEIPADCGVAIEYSIPNTAYRVDFILTGYDADHQHRAIIVELKQWSEVYPLEGVEQLLRFNQEAEIQDVRTFLGGTLRKTAHPSYQAWSYSTFISDYNSNVETVPIHLKSCAYLHNYYLQEEDDPLFKPYFTEILKEAPLFCRKDVGDLKAFIKRYIRKGDRKKTLYYLENGLIKPTKSLQDALGSMLKGNREFVLIDEQKIAYEEMLSFATRSAEDGKKRVYIVHGGPGTGKTVIAINLLVELTRDEQVCAYVTKNSAPRKVFEIKLRSGGTTRRHIGNLFKSSTAFTASESDDYATLIVDEAHRLTKRGQLGPRVIGEDQIKEIINAARCTIFFIDEQQRVTAQDYGSRERILYWAQQFDAEVEEAHLASQFRCKGSDDYLLWLDSLLGISSSTAQRTLEGVDYDFQVVDSPTRLREMIVEKNKIDNKARLVAGYCWEWRSRNNMEAQADIIIGDFAMYWNLRDDAVFAISEHSINQVGCIHTTQGLEFSYVGVIIGDDLRYENGEVITDFTKRAKSDKSLHGLLGKVRKGDMEAAKAIDTIIRNTYRTLLSRGLKGCYVYCTDHRLADYIRSRLGSYQSSAILASAAAEQP